MVDKGKRIDRIGEIGTNSNGLRMKIVQYRSATDIDIEFDSGYIARGKSYAFFRKGLIRDRVEPLKYKKNECACGGNVRKTWKYCPFCGVNLSLGQ